LVDSLAITAAAVLALPIQEAAIPAVVPVSTIEYFLNNAGGWQTYRPGTPEQFSAFLEKTL
jgi:hypothetical protein